MKTTAIVLASLAAIVAVGCGSIKKLTAHAPQVEVLSSTQQDKDGYWQQEWKLSSDAPVALRFVAGTRPVILLPDTLEGRCRYTVTLRLARIGKDAQGLMALAQDGESGKGALKMVNSTLTLPGVPGGSLRSAVQPLGIKPPVSVPTDLVLLSASVAGAAKPQATLSVVDRATASSLRSNGR